MSVCPSVCHTTVCVETIKRLIRLFHVIVPSSLIFSHIPDVRLHNSDEVTLIGDLK